ncbi:MAG: 6-bladed beta-propeller [bacterium]|nr:6-bladed beta-propeller [bacterium]
MFIKKNAAMMTVLLFSCWFSLFNLNLHGEVENNRDPLKGEWEFRLENVWETFEAGDESLAQINGIGVGDDGKVYVFDFKHFKFFVFSPEGKFLFSFGKKGEGPGEYKFSLSFHLVDKYLLVVDFGAVHYFTKQGKFVKTARTPGRFSFKSIVDENRFITLQPKKEGNENIETLELFNVSDNKSTTIIKIKPEESTQVQSGGMALQIKMPGFNPVIVMDAKDEFLFYGKNDKYRIIKTNLQGKELMTFSVDGKEKKPITDEMKRKSLGRISLNGGKIPEPLLKKMMKNIPDEATYFNEIRIDESGLIYVYLTDLNNGTGREMDVFSPEGKYLYHGGFTLPEGFLYRSSVIKGDYLYAAVEDEEGEQKLVKFKIAKPKD